MAKPTGLTKSSRWQIGVRRTVPFNAATAWAILTSRQGIRIWLGELEAGDLQDADHFTLPDGSKGAVRVYRPGSHLRLTRDPGTWSKPSTIQVRVIPKGDRSVIAFHEENLPSEKERLKRRDHYRRALDELADITSQSAGN